jgi:hypothetical protein
MGSKAAGRMVGSSPGLDDSQLDDEDNPPRNLRLPGAHCALLEQWLEADAGRDHS